MDVENIFIIKSIKEKDDSAWDIPTRCEPDPLQVITCGGLCGGEAVLGDQAGQAVRTEVVGDAVKSCGRVHEASSQHIEFGNMSRSAWSNGCCEDDVRQHEGPAYLPASWGCSAVLSLLPQ